MSSSPLRLCCGSTAATSALSPGAAMPGPISTDGWSRPRQAQVPEASGWWRYIEACQYSGTRSDQGPRSNFSKKGYCRTILISSSSPFLWAFIATELSCSVCSRFSASVVSARRFRRLWMSLRCFAMRRWPSAKRRLLALKQSIRSVKCMLMEARNHSQLAISSTSRSRSAM